MSVDRLSFEIQEIADPDGGILIELLVDGERTATATASPMILNEMRTEFGLDRDAVVQILREALEDHLKGRLPKMAVSEPKEIAGQELKFVSHYTYRHFDKVHAGVVWYDVQASETGPEDVPAVVRNQIRFAVHRKLTEGSKNARGLVELLK